MSRITSGLGVKIPDMPSVSRQIETAVEMGTQYPNPWILRLLKKAKRKGLSVYAVSDFYLPQDSYYLFLKRMNLEETILLPYTDT